MWFKAWERFDVGIDGVVERFDIVEFSYLVDLCAELANCGPTEGVEIERRDYGIPHDLLYCPIVSLLLLDWEGLCCSNERGVQPPIVRGGEKRT